MDQTKIDYDNYVHRKVVAAEMYNKSIFYVRLFVGIGICLCCTIVSNIYIKYSAILIGLGVIGYAIAKENNFKNYLNNKYNIDPSAKKGVAKIE